MCFRAVKYLPPRQSYWLYLIHPLSCLTPIYIDYSSMSWLRSKMAAALPQWRCYSLIAIWDFSLCGALGLLCLWQMLSYVHELSYKPTMCFSPSSPLNRDRSLRCLVCQKRTWSGSLGCNEWHIMLIKWELQKRRDFLFPDQYLWPLNWLQRYYHTFRESMNE